MKTSISVSQFDPATFLVMVVTDAARDLQVFDQTLSQVGYHITFCTDKKQILQRLQQDKPDLILLDLMVSEISGLEICQLIRSYHDWGSIPIIFLSASSEQEYMLQAFESGASDYLIKPIFMPELLARVKTHLRLHRSRQALQEAYQQLEKMTLLDPLTGIGNRRALKEFADQEFKRVERYGGEFSIMMVDVDHFKQVNDTYGHHYGDDCLVLIAQTLKRNLRGVDHVGRFGGEEFMIILPETPLDLAIALGKRLRHAVSHLCPKFEKQVINLSVSVGVSVVHKADKTVQDVLQRADDALYLAKVEGRNCVRYVRP